VSSSRDPQATSGFGALPRLGETLATIGERFSRVGAFGLVLVDANPLSAIERGYGQEAYARTMGALAGLAHEVAREHLDGDELIVSGETGRHEIVVMMFRPQGDARFYRDALPAVGRELARAVERRGQQVVYPFLRKAPVFGVGWATALRNPHFGAASQVREALEEARADAALAARNQALTRRKQLVGIVMAGEITSVYEPIVDVATKTVYAYEALARGPAGTDLHSPMALFEGAAEEGLLFELDCLCRRSGLEGAVGLPEGTKLFLNVRPTSIHDPNFQPDALIRTLAESGLQPSDVVFEVSEQESIQNFQVFREVRDEYGKLGFQIALDDTGSGYASLQAVIELAPDYIKMDRSLVADIDKDPARQTLLRALHSVAREFGAKIVAEGLSTLEELETLGQLGIPFGQGWLFGKPTPLRAG
jgi:EAL domain-containing protein (putative c-di-GMP-specific phosphodiesterase class I)